jgi:hypothetical protein
MRLAIRYLHYWYLCRITSVCMENKCYELVVTCEVVLGDRCLALIKAECLSCLFVNVSGLFVHPRSM